MRKTKAMKVGRILYYLTAATIVLLITAGCATIKGAIDLESLLPERVYISPAIPDGNNDELIIPLDVFPDPKIIIRGFRFTVMEVTGEPVYVFENSIPVPKQFAGKKEREKTIDIIREIIWNGKDMDGNFVADGEYTYFAEAWDGYGNTGATPNFTVIVDNTPPVSTITSPYLLFSPNKDGRKDKLILEYKDSSSEDIWTGAMLDVDQKVVSQWEWIGMPETLEWDGLNKDGNAAADGAYLYVLSSTDRAGNAFSASVTGIVVDTRQDPITLTLSARYFSPNSDGIKDVITLTPFLEQEDNVVNWSIDIEGENTAVIKIADGEGLPPKGIIYNGKSRDGVLLADGPYKAVLRVLYKNGNFPEAESDLFIVDTVLPVISSLAVDFTLFSPDGDGNKDFVTIKQGTSSENLWEGRISDSKNKTVADWVWEGTAQDLKWFGRNTAGTILPDGSYMYILASEDPAGNRIVNNLGPIVLDSRPTPVSISTDIAFISPNGDGKKDSLTVRTVLGVKDGVRDWKLEIQDSQKKTVRTFEGIGTPPAEIVFDGKTAQAKVAADGSYQGVMSVSYAKGNIATGYTPNFTIDTISPQVTSGADIYLISPNGDGRRDKVKINQSGSTEDLWEGVILNASGKSIWKQSWKGNLQSFEWNGTDTLGKTVPDGTYVYKITATDRADNQGTAQTAGIIVDNRATPVAISTVTKSFSPNGDGVKDTITYAVSITVPTGITNWFVSIIDDKGKTWKTFTGNGSPAPSIIWNGEGSDKRITEGDYYAELSVEYEKGDVSRARTSGTSFIDITPPSIAAVMTPMPFSPDGDGIEDTLSIDIAVKDRSQVSRWQVDILDPYKRPFKRFQGTGAPVSRISWNGKSETGELVQSAEDYPVIITAEDDLSNKATIEKKIAIDILVVKDGDRLKIIISSIYFKPYTADYLDRTSIDPERVDKNIATLNRLAEILKKYNDYSVRLEGHAVRIYWDNPAKGSAEESEVLLPLSQARAKAIKTALVERGLKEVRLTTFGYGGTQPIVPHSDLDNRWKNRRVEFILIK